MFRPLSQTLRCSTYTASTSGTQTLTVTTATVTVTFTAADKTYDGTNTAAVSNCAVLLGRFDLRQHLPHGIYHSQQSAGDLCIQQELAIAQARKQALSCMCDFFQFGKT